MPALRPRGLAALSLLLPAALWLLGPEPLVPALYPAAAEACPIPVERPGVGLLCLTPAQAAARRLLSGDQELPLRTFGPPARMAPGRLLAAAVAIDLNRGGVAELVALPGIGPALAARVIEARPLKSPADLARIVGPRRAKELAPLLKSF